MESLTPDDGAVGGQCRSAGTSELKLENLFFRMPGARSLLRSPSAAAAVGSTASVGLLHADAASRLVHGSASASLRCCSLRSMWLGPRIRFVLWSPAAGSTPGRVPAAAAAAGV